MNKHHAAVSKLPVNLSIQVHRRLANTIIEFALEDLEDPQWNALASKFFSSDWFVYLCTIVQMDSQVIRRYVKQSSGYVTQSQRRALAVDTRAIAKSKRKKYRSGRTKLIAISPEGEAMEVNGYTYAAKLVGCSAPAVYYAVKGNRKCLGWTFLLKGGRRGGV